MNLHSFTGCILRERKKELDDVLPNIYQKGFIMAEADNFFNALIQRQQLDKEAKKSVLF